MIEVWQSQDTLRRPALRFVSLSHSSGLPHRLFMIVQGSVAFLMGLGQLDLWAGTLPKSGLFRQFDCKRQTGANGTVHAMGFCNGCAR